MGEMRGIEREKNQHWTEGERLEASVYRSHKANCILKDMEPVITYDKKGEVRRETDIEESRK